MTRTGAAVSQRVDLVPGIDAPRCARTVTRSLLDGRLGARRANDMLILVTELVTNAVRHAGLAPHDRIELHLTARSGVVRAEVRDPGPGFVPVEREPGAGGGFGLMLLRTLPDRWGISAPGPTCVWFEIDF